MPLAGQDAAVQMIEHVHGARASARCMHFRRQAAVHGPIAGRTDEQDSCVADGHGLPVRLALAGGEAYDNRLAGKLLSRLKSGTILLADRGYDADWIRALAARKGVWANIPLRCNKSTP